MSRQEVKVLVVDDQAPFRRAARAVVDETPGFDVIAEAMTGEEAVAVAAQLEPDLVLMDVNMAGIGGIEATRRIVAARQETVVVLLSSYEDAPTDADGSGAAAYVPKGEFGRRVLEEFGQANPHPRPGKGVQPSPAGEPPPAT
jgi:DNA-binding NarL/FixJ family response regulator